MLVKKNVIPPNPILDDPFADEAEYYKNKFEMEKEHNWQRFKSYKQFDAQVNQRRQSIQAIWEANKKRKSAQQVEEQQQATVSSPTAKT